MNHRPFATAAVALCLPCLGFSNGPGKPPASPAEFFPAHTYFYAQLNPAASVRGAKGLKLAKLLEDPALKDLVAKALRQIPAQQRPDTLLARYPLDKALGEHIGIGVVGFQSVSGTFGQQRQTVRYPQAGRVPSNIFQQRADFKSEMLVAIEIKDEVLFQKTLLKLLQDTILGGKTPQTSTATYSDIDMMVWKLPGIGKVYHRFHKGYFLLAQSGEVLAEALERQNAKSASLATRADFAHFAEHRGEKTAAGFAHIGADSAIDLFSPLIPRRQREEIAMWGGFDFSGIQFGLGFHEGGICEWFHMAFAENPKGILMNLCRLFPSVGYAETDTHRGLVYSASLTFDWAACYNATSFFLDLCDVSTKEFERDVHQELGMDLREDLMSALGNTVGAVAVMPRLGLIPELSLVFQVRNRAKMEQVLAKLKKRFAAEGIPMKDFTVPGNGPKATYLNLGKDIPIKPAFALNGDKLVVSMMPLMLKYAVRKSRRTGLAMIDFLPDANAIGSMARFEYSYDPAPLAENLYADLLKLMDSSDRRLPIDATDLPAPETIAAAMSKIGIDVCANPYYMAVDLHSPVGIALPAAIGSALLQIQQQQEMQRQRALQRNKVKTKPKPKPTIHTPH